jgi:hypothetical protein
VALYNVQFEIHHSFALAKKKFANLNHGLLYQFDKNDTMHTNIRKTWMANWQLFIIKGQSMNKWLL